MKLDNLLNGLLPCANPKALNIRKSCEIFGLSFDSRRAHKGDLFFCKGEDFKSQYAFDALEKGICAICFEKNAAYAEEISHTIKTYFPKTASLQVDNVKQFMTLCSDIFYGNPFSKLKSIAVTGTKGKSSTVQMICQILNQNPRFRGAILNDFLPPDAPTLTTPESPDLFFSAHRCAELGYTHIVCEISSQAVKEERIFGINFDMACFLNFGRDHISPREHKNEHEYFDCKKRLFFNCRCAVINSDCPKSDDIIHAIKENDAEIEEQKKTEIYTFGFNKSSDMRGENIKKTAEGCVFSINTIKKSFDICVTGEGLFNAQNALCASAVGTLCGANEHEIFNGIALSRVKGRMERLLSFDKNIEVIVDYAHNKMSFEAMFSHAAELGRPITAVFGCCGDKAICRRSELPEVALRYADRIILTEDDSASEGFEHIKNDVLKNVEVLISSHPELQKLKTRAKLSVISDRKTAIKSAIISAFENKEKRTVLILGKGCEQVMLTEKGKAFYEGDKNIAKKVLDSYAAMYETAFIIANTSVFNQRITVLSEDERALDQLFSALELLPVDVNLCAICPQDIEKSLRRRCFKLGRREKIFELSHGKKATLGNGICFYIAPQGDELIKLACDIAARSCSSLLVYISRERGIMLNGEGFVKSLSLDSARLINKYTKTPCLEHLISALDHGVERCAVIDGNSKMSLIHLVSGLEFSGSEIVK